MILKIGYSVLIMMRKGGMNNLGQPNEKMYHGEIPLRCTTQDEKGLVFNAILFYPIFWSP